MDATTQNRIISESDPYAPPLAAGPITVRLLKSRDLPTDPAARAELAEMVGLEPPDPAKAAAREAVLRALPVRLWPFTLPDEADWPGPLEAWHEAAQGLVAQGRASLELVEVAPDLFTLWAFPADCRATLWSPDGRRVLRRDLEARQ
jgi:hypothetical protein